MKEILDIFDESGEKIGEMSREEIHKVGAWHKSVHIYLINAKNQLLMQLRSKNKDIGPNVWDISVGGHVDLGEDSLTSAQRELKEELGIEAEKGEFEFLFTQKEILKNGNYVSKEFVDVYLIEKDVTEKDVKLQLFEVQKFEFVDISTFIEKVREKDKKFSFHIDEYLKMIPILEEKFLKK